MIPEFMFAGLVVYGFNKFQHRNERKFKNKFNEIMLAAGVKNTSDNTFKIYKIEKTNYGYFCLISIAEGLNFKKLEDIKGTIQDNLSCLCELEKDKFSDYIKMKIIINPLNDLKFTPVLTKANEFFLGYDFSGKPIKLNFDLFSHLLIAGVTGTGKSRLVFIALTNLIHNHSEKEVEIYLTQVRKKDLKHYKKCKQVKWYSETLEDTKLMFSRIDKIIQKREEKFEMNDVENISEYNRSANRKMKYIYLCTDEFSFYMPDPSDTDEIGKLKSQVLQLLKNIILTGRSSGVNVICSVQRTTVDNIPSTIKSQMTRLTFRQISALNSRNVIEIDDAVNLKPQEAILMTNQYTYLKTPFIDKEIIKKHIKNSIIKEKLQTISQKKVSSKPIIYGPEKHEQFTLEEYKKLKENKISNKANVDTKSQNSKIKKRKNGVISLEMINNANSKR